MIRRLCAVWPPWWALILGAATFVALQMPYLFLEWTARKPFFSMHDVQTQNVLAATLGVYVVLYAAYRVWVFHPALRTGYYHWLRGTPWTSRHPLPLGPIHLVWQDLLLLAIVVAVGWLRLQEQALVIAVAFLIAYLLMLGAVHFVTGTKYWAFATGFSMGLIILCLRDPLSLVCAGAAGYAIAYLGLRAALAGFPWDQSFIQRVQEVASPPKGTKQVGVQADLGWPYNRTGPMVSDMRGLAMSDASLLAALAGWWFFAILYQCRMLPDVIANGYLVYYGCLVFGIAIRLAVYCDGYWPPLSLLGRLAHGRWVIPGYDQVFAAPLLAVVVGVAALVVPRLTGLDPLLTIPVAFDLTLWILLGMGPSLQAWRLTGNHRIVPGIARGSQLTR